MRHNLPFSPDMEVATTDQILTLWCSTTWESDSSLKSLLLNILLRGKIVQIPIEEPLPERKICLIRNVKKATEHCARSLEEHLTSHRETE